MHLSISGPHFNTYIHPDGPPYQDDDSLSNSTSTTKKVHWSTPLCEYAISPSYDTTPSKHVQWTLPWRSEIVRQRRARKQKERHEQRQRRLATINEDKFLSISHLRALEEQLQLKTYLNDNDNDIADELQEERERLRTRLALCQAAQQQRPLQA